MKSRRGDGLRACGTRHNLLVMRGEVAAVVPEVPSEAGPRVAVEHETEYFGRVEQVQGVFAQPTWRFAGCDNDYEPVDEPREQCRVEHGRQRWRVDDDVVIPLARLLD